MPETTRFATELSRPQADDWAPSGLAVESEIAEPSAFAPLPQRLSASALALSGDASLPARAQAAPTRTQTWAPDPLSRPGRSVRGGAPGAPEPGRGQAGAARSAVHLTFARACVVPSATVAAHRGVRDILDEAEHECQRIVLQSHEAARVARDEGFASGQAAARAEMAGAQMQALVTRDAYLAQADGHIVAVVIGAVRKIVAGFDNQELTKAVVATALQRMRHASEVELRVAPSQVAALTEAVQGLYARFPGLKVLEIVGDSALPPGSCVLRSELGTVETSIPAQLAAIERAVLSAAAAERTSDAN